MPGFQARASSSATGPGPSARHFDPSDFRMIRLLGRLTACAIMCVHSDRPPESMLGTKNQEQANPCGNLRNQKPPPWRPAPTRCDGDSTMSDDLVYTEPVYTERADTAIATRA